MQAAFIVYFLDLVAKFHIEERCTIKDEIRGSQSFQIIDHTCYWNINIKEDVQLRYFF